MRKNNSIVEYLAFLSAKYEVDPDRFFQALILARDTSESRCGEFLIKCRGETKGKFMFLILTSSKVVAQFPVSKEFLLESSRPIRDFMKTGAIRRCLVKKSKESKDYTIKDLESGMTQVCLKAKVLEIPKPILVYTRYGNYAYVSNALIADETGKIRLCLWNDQIYCISTGDTIKIENARATTFKGQKQLNIGRNGLLSSVD